VLSRWVGVDEHGWRASLPRITLGCSGWRAANRARVEAIDQEEHELGQLGHPAKGTTLVRFISTTMHLLMLRNKMNALSCISFKLCKLFGRHAKNILIILGNASPNELMESTSQTKLVNAHRLRNHYWALQAAFLTIVSPWSVLKGKRVIKTVSRLDTLLPPFSQW
jgi:hypothetical protein